MVQVQPGRVTDQGDDQTEVLRLETVLVRHAGGEHSESSRRATNRVRARPRGARRSAERLDAPDELLAEVAGRRAPREHDPSLAVEHPVSRLLADPRGRRVAVFDGVVWVCELA